MVDLQHKLADRLAKGFIDGGPAEAGHYVHLKYTRDVLDFVPIAIF
jgi:hypothetical protein